MQRIISREDATYEQAILEENRRLKLIKIISCHHLFSIVSSRFNFMVICYSNFIFLVQSIENCAINMVVDLPQ